MSTRLKDIITVLPVALIALGAVFLLSHGRSEVSKPEPQGPTAEPEETPPVEILYGIPVSDYLISQGKITRGESLAQLLYPHGVSAQQIHLISRLPDSLLNERKIQPGNRFAVFSNLDTLPACFVYEKDAQHYVRVMLYPDSISAKNLSKEVAHRVRFASGTIESSLWESMQTANYDPILAVELSEIFAWSIDFFGIQEGDRYKVIYEESFVDSSSIGINRILGAWFLHNNTEFWGIPLEQDGRISFFDEKGNSLRKAFLKAPLRFSRISSGFSHSRYHPVLKIRRPHHGVDYAAPAGTPVHSVGDGVVTARGFQRNGGGNYVKIKHNSVYSTTYMHLSRFGKGITRGQYVKQGDVIGYVGSTGLATGPHLDFRFYKNGSAVNPLKVEAPPVEPVHQENLAAYAIRKQITMGLLKLI
jgi:murein DD-endopeptidase MepM/ murein hydrolase activator NlpD